jgi:3D (Asp-Asp-Asp) domain-containing protein
MLRIILTLILVPLSLIEVSSTSVEQSPHVPLYQNSTLNGEELFVPLIIEEETNTIVENREHLDNLDEQEPSEETSSRGPRGRWVWARVTAYTHHYASCGKRPSDPGYGITSTGVNVLSGDPNDAYGIAADPRAVPYGTRIYVPGYYESLLNNQNFVPTEMIDVDDTGGALRNSWSRERIIHLDVRYRTETAARNWGVRWMQVFIYD